MIEVNGLKKKIDNNEIIKDLSFKIADGEIVGVFGVKDAGKTLLLKILMDIVKPDAGQILIENKLNNRTVLKEIAYVSNEKGMFYDMSSAEHMQFLRYYYPRFSEDIFKQYMEYFQVPINAPMDKLKEHEIRKAEMAIALAKNTKILILDDPFKDETPKDRKKYLKTMFSTMRKDKIVLVAARNSQGMKDVVNRALILEK